MRRPSGIRQSAGSPASRQPSHQAADKQALPPIPSMSNATGYVPHPPPIDPSCEREYLYGVLMGGVVVAAAIGLMVCVVACQPRKRIKQITQIIKMEEEGTLMWKDGKYELSRPLLTTAADEAGATAA